MILSDGVEVTAQDGTRWRIVASDMYRLRYHQDDQEAMDRTNQDYLMGGMDTDLERDWSDPDGPESWAEDETWGWVGRFHNRRSYDDGRDWFDWPTGPRDPRGSDAQTVGADWQGTWLVVRIGSDADEWWQECSRSLANYPLLDENAYSALEWEAWARWWGDDGARDLVNEIADDLADALEEAGCPDDLRDAVEELDPSVIAEVAFQGMNYWDGWDGSYDADGAQGAAIEHVVAAWRLCQWLARQGGRVNERARGIALLPGIGWDVG